jgi:hypothetical protein
VVYRLISFLLLVVLSTTNASANALDDADTVIAKAIVAWNTNNLGLYQSIFSVDYKEDLSGPPSIATTPSLEASFLLALIGTNSSNNSRAIAVFNWIQGNFPLVRATIKKKGCFYVGPQISCKLDFSVVASDGANTFRLEHKGIKQGLTFENGEWKLLGDPPEKGNPNVVSNPHSSEGGYNSSSYNGSYNGYNPQPASETVLVTVFDQYQYPITGAIITELETGIRVNTNIYGEATLPKSSLIEIDTYAVYATDVTVAVSSKAFIHSPLVDDIEIMMNELPSLEFTKEGFLSVTAPVETMSLYLDNMEAEIDVGEGYWRLSTDSFSIKEISKSIRSHSEGDTIYVEKETIFDYYANRNEWLLAPLYPYDYYTEQLHIMYFSDGVLMLHIGE